MKDKPVVSSVWCIQTFDAHLSNWAICIGDDARDIRGKTFENREKDNFEDWKSSGISIIKRGLGFVVPNLRSKKSSELHKKNLANSSIFCQNFERVILFSFFRRGGQNSPQSPRENLWQFDNPKRQIFHISVNS